MAQSNGDQPIVQVDAFTSERFGGNPAAVCLLDAPREDRWLQAVAREMNLSETAFLWRRTDGFDLRWFTPTTEVRLCGHATLASAHALWDGDVLPAAAEARFHTLSGVLRARRELGPGQGAGARPLCSRAPAERRPAGVSFRRAAAGSMAARAPSTPATTRGTPATSSDRFRGSASIRAGW